MKAYGVCLCVLLFGIICWPQQEADYTRGTFLLGSCQIAVNDINNGSHGNTEDHFEAYRDGLCRGLIEGVSDASPKVCPPENGTYGQEYRIVLKYLQDHPEELHLKNTALIQKALMKAFPCQ